MWEKKHGGFCNSNQFFVTVPRIDSSGIRVVMEVTSNAWKHDKCHKKKGRHMNGIIVNNHPKASSIK